MFSIYDEENSSIFLKVFGASPQLRLLDFFLDNSNHDFSKREIMEAIGMAKRTLHEYLPILLEEDAVKVTRKIRRAELYALNKESPIVQCFLRVEKELTRAGRHCLDETEEIAVE